MPSTLISQSERQIRAAVIDRARELFPSARIIHELNVDHGECRADVAAVTEDTLTLIEVKSERDTLGRLPNQLRAFGPVAHHVIVAAHERWCSGSRYPNCDVEKIIGHARCGHLWRYPEPEGKWGLRHWSVPSVQTRPWPHQMLRLLWTDELQRLAARHGVPRAHRAPGYRLADQLSLLLPGSVAERAVCAALRAREFAEADAPIVEEQAA